MKLAIVGSRSLKNVALDQYLPQGVEEIVSGGAAGIDTLAAEYARQNGLKLTEIFPRYDRYGRAAPILRNKRIVEYADQILAFWDGSSKGTLSVVRYAEKIGKPIKMIPLSTDAKLD